MIKKRFKVAVAVLGMSAMICGCNSVSSDTASDSSSEVETKDVESSESADSTDPIAVAGIVPLTGDMAQYGEAFQSAFEDCIAEYNEAGGWNGREIELELYDDKGDPKETVNIGNKILAEDKYISVLGPFSSTCGLALAEVLDEEEMFTFAPVISHPDFVDTNEYTLSYSHKSKLEGIFSARYLKEWGGSKVAGIYSNNDFGVTLSDAFAAESEAQGMEVVASEPFIVGQTKDFSSILTKIRNAGADSLYLMGQYNEIGQILLQINDMGWDDVNVLACSSTFMQETLDIASEGAEGVRWATAFTPENPNEDFQAYRANFQEKYGKDIDLFYAYGYDTCRIFLDGLDKSENPEGKEILSNILEIRDFDILSGKCFFEETRDITRGFFIAEPNAEGAYEIIDAPDIMD